MAQDTSSLPTPPQAPIAGVPTDQAGAPQVATPVLSPIAVDPANVVHAHEVQVDGDVLAVPQESVGLGDASASVPVSQPVAVEPVVLPPTKPEAVVESVAPMVPPPPPSGGDDAPAVSLPAEPPASESDGSLPADTDSEGTPDGEKSPLDILEEILAGAEAEKKQVDEEKQKKEQEEADFQAQLDAKTAEFKIEADERLKQSHEVVEQAKQQRTDIDNQLIEQGKLEPQATIEKDEFSIHQLEHKKPE